ncbi:MAG: hypothetical protein GVY18_09050 [Bacteroidetes bacterium]|jgi:hypothetical protein|nr:hypothetical protein [Bacteroidota bacterium]
MPENYPNTTGFEPTFTDIELQWNGNTYQGFKELNKRHTVDRSHAEGSSYGPVGTARGAYQGGEGDIMVLRRTLKQMLQDMGNGYTRKMFTIFEQQVIDGESFTDEYQGCSLKELDTSQSRGPDATYTKISFMFQKLVTDGVEP